MNSTRRRFPGPFVVVLALAVSTLIARSSAFWRDVAAIGGVVESVSDTQPRHRMSRDQLAALLPAERGPFVFPAPYNTRGLRLTGAADCDGTDCVAPLAQTSQRSLNNSGGSSTLYAVITLRRDGAGATLFSIDKNIGEVTRIGPAFGTGNPLNDTAADNFSFSATQPTALYGHDTRRLYRHDVLAHTETTVVDLTSSPAVAVLGPGRQLGHVTTDNSDAVHAFVLKDAVTNLAQGCGVYREAATAYSYFPSTPAFDDCTIDKSGRYLILFEGDRTRVVDLQTTAEMSLAGGPGGSIGRGDTGYGYTVNEDTRGTWSAAMTRWFLDRPFADPSQRLVQHTATEWAEQVTSFSHGNAVAGDPAGQYGCSVTTYLRRPTPIAREGELICYPLDGSLRVLVVAPAMTDVEGAGGRTAADRWTRVSLDPTGQFLMWTSNLEGSGRLDAFVVQVPAAHLAPEPPTTDIVAPVVHLVNPGRSATLAGTIELEAEASDNVGLTAIQFAVDGVSLGAQLDDGEFGRELDTTTLSDGIHFVTVTAWDAAGNTATTPPVLVTVMNAPAGPQIATIASPVVTPHSAIIEWTTTQLADTRVDFGLTSSYGSSPVGSLDLAQRHLQVLSGLSPGTTYHYRLQSTNPSGAVTSDDLTLTTPSSPPDPSTLPGLADDGLSHPPPSTGDYAYNSFAPPLLPGVTYADPVFGTVVRRLTTDHEPDDIYARNMWWNADGTKYLHGGKVVSVATGEITHVVSRGSSSSDAGFDPVDPNALYYYDENAIHRVVLSQTSAETTDSIFFQAPSEIWTLGGTINWFDASGRYFLVRYGPEPSIHLYDRFNIAAGPYANAVDAALNVETGSYVGITPDGQYLVGYESGSPPLGKGVSWKVDHASRTVAPANYFWSLCGDHGSFVSASDGRNYMVVAACLNFPEIWRVDITNNADGLNETQQKALPNNMRLIRWPTWDDEVHFSTIARGPFRDWAFVSLEDATDTFNTGIDAGGVIAPWRPYRQEIVAFHVLTGEIRRLVHHRSRSTDADYAYMPRLSTSWAGEQIGWSSNFNDPLMVDIMTLSFGAAPPSLTGITASAITGTTAAIAWTTDLLADSQVEYGTTTDYGSTTTLDAARMLSHHVGLTGLLPGTTYHFRVRSTTSAGLTSTSADAMFTTVAPPTLSGISATGITETAAAISWSTDQAATAHVEYGLTSTYGNTTTVDTSLATAHSVPLTGLAIGTTYHYRVISTNSIGLTTVSADFVFSTIAMPVVSDVAVSSITGNSARISWTTDQETDSRVEYGLTSAYGSTTVLVPALVTSHIRPLTGLDIGTTYHFRVVSTNSVGLTAMSADATFTTVGAPAIGGVTATGVTGTSATIGWTTDQATTSQVEYGTTTAFGNQTTLDSSLATAHSQTLTGLAPGTTYFYRVQSTNDVGLPSSSGTETFTTVAMPVISNVTASPITGSTALVSWTTDQPATSQIEYGVSTAYGSATTLDAALTTAHAQALSGLAAGTTYHYRVTSTNSVGLVVTSDDATFTTVAAPTISGVTASAVTGSSATIAWTTNQATTSHVEYGTTTAFGSQTTPDGSLVTAHSQPLTGLTPGTTYFYRVHSTNDVGLPATSGTASFTTVAVPVVSDVTASTITGSSALISWTTDQPTTSLIEYGLSTAYGSATTFDAALTTAHAQALSGLAAGTTYHYRVTSTNSVGLVVTSGDATLTTVALPTISIVTASDVTGSSATIAWTTDQATNSQVEYGPTSAYGSSTTLDPALTTTHAQALAGLSHGTTYHYRVRSVNPVGLVVTSADFTFTTVAPPAIAGVAALGATGTAVTIGWTTDQPADSLVEYGPTTAYGTTSALDPSFVTNHAQSLNGLTPGAAYHFRVRSTNAVGLTTTSADDTFTMVPATVVSNVVVSNITGSSAAFTWATDQTADTQIEYGTTTAYGSFSPLDATLLTAHSQTLTGLTPGTTYHFRVRSTNDVGLTSASPDGSFTTIAVPVITGTSASGITGSAVTIAWTTDQPTTSLVEYGLSTAYGTSTAVDAALVTSHSQPLSGLTPGALYHYRVTSTNDVGLTATSADATFTTVAAPIISDVAIAALTGSAATISWTTDQPAHSQIEFGATTTYGNVSALDSTLATSHGQTISGLANGTTYHFRVRSANVHGTLAISADGMFTTIAPSSIATVTVSNITPTSATIAWSTSQPTDAQVEYGPTTAYGTTSSSQTGLAISHGVVLNGLAIGTTYHFRIRSTNNVGLLSVSTDATFTTVPPPMVTGVSAPVVTNASATVVWATSQPADSIVEYGLTSGYGSATMLDATMVTSHAVAFSGLAADTTYHYRVISRNAFGLSNASADLTFKTAAAVSESGITLTILKGGPGTGTVKGPGTLDCGSICSADLTPGTLVTLTAIPGSGAIFAGWSGACSNAQPTCTLTLTTAASVTATFTTATSGDFDGDGFADLVWQHNDGTLALWTMQGTSRLSSQFITGLGRTANGGLQLNADLALTPDSRVLDPNWHIVATPDLDGNGKADLLWQHDVTGELAAWIMERHVRVRAQAITPGAIDPSWHLQASSDLNGDGKADLLWHQNGTNLLAVWFMNGTSRISEQTLSPATVPAEWRLVGSADFDADGQLDLVWQSRTTGDTYLWYMDGTSLRLEQAIGRFGDDWQARAVGDFDRDGHPDLIWQKSTGDLAAWFMNGIAVTSAVPLSPSLVSAGWTIVGAR